MSSKVLLIIVLFTFVAFGVSSLEDVVEDVAFIKLGSFSKFIFHSVFIQFFHSSYTELLEL